MLASLLALCFLTTACRAPGEPPTHPGTGVYRDLIRRETDSAHTALATTKLLIRTAQTQGLPQTYARVTLRSISGDLRNVVVDLNQIHPPTAAIKPQGRLSTIAAQDAVLVTLLQRHWDDRALQTAVLRQVGRHADEIANILSAQLQH
ncbi:MAG TPA: hypothetical protein VGO31_03340 [Microbacteriaceae bacterium]|jgi:hypothetical protein|nr:hypothetical protein [Microbacteriaceae bacterium]